jgi:phosphopantetheinyl transferase
LPKSPFICGKKTSLSLGIFASMSLIWQRQTNGAEAAIWKIEESAEELEQMLQLDEREKKFLAALKSGKRYLHWLSSRVLIRRLLNTDEFIQMEANGEGKPELKNFPHQISISHSHDLAAVILSLKRTVGIDIELIHPKVHKIKNRFLSTLELHHLQCTDQELITCWCAKEALFKFYGLGKVEFKEDLALHLPSLSDSGVIPSVILKTQPPLEVDVHYEKVEDYMVAWLAG